MAGAVEVCAHTVIYPALPDGGLHVIPHFVTWDRKAASCGLPLTALWGRGMEPLLPGSQPQEGALGAGRATSFASLPGP